MAVLDDLAAGVRVSGLVHTHPTGLTAAGVRGTKIPDIAAIPSLAPDLVIANKEEHRRIDVHRLRDAGVPVWVTVIETWMVVGRDTFTDDLLRRRGYRNVFADHPDRYSTVALAEIDRADVDLILLPDEPYPFPAADGPKAFTTARTTLVSGRLPTWHGPSLLEAAAFTA